jgi:hypothetical protein
MSIKSHWMAEDTQRTQVLERARECAQLTKPWMLTRQSQSPENALPNTWQNIGSDGVTNLVGRMLSALFPPEVPWLRLDINPEIRYSPNVTNEELQIIEQEMFKREMLLMSMVESHGFNDPDDYGNRYNAGFRTAQAMALSQIVVTGETLIHMDDDFKFTVFRRDQYVTRRDSQCSVMFHIIREKIDPLTLTDEQIAAAGLNKAELMESDCTCAHREAELYTMIEWQPWTKTWMIRQEVNERIINESEEKISPFYSVPFELVPGEHYARSFIESKRPDLKTLNEASFRLIQWAALASKANPVIDYSAEVREEDLEKDSGKPFRARVEGGMVQDIGFMSMGGKLNDVSFLANFVRDKEQRLGQSMLIGSESVRKSERTTAFEIARITMEQIQGALGGFYTPVADALQLPIAHRGMYLLEKKRYITSLPKKAMSIKILTGLAALSRENKASAMLDVAQVAQMLGPQALAKINPTVFLDVYARLRGIDEPGMVKTDAELQQEQQREMARKAQEMATQEGIAAVSNVAQAAINPNLIS